MTATLSNLDRLCIHTFTTKPWSLEEAVAGYASAGVPAISVWREHIEPMGAEAAGKLLRASGLSVVSLVRGGFFVDAGAAGRQAALDENRRAIDEAAAIGAPLLVLVCGASPEVPLPLARQQIVDGIAAVLPHAKAAGVKLAIEPLHPMYADCRSAVSTLEQANNMVFVLDSDQVGVAVDVYHLWWDNFLRAEIERAGKSIFAFHVCDWKTPTNDMLLDRGLMGEGCINIPEIRGWVEKTGFDGFIEVEVFSSIYWEQEQAGYVERIKDAYLRCV